MAEMVLGFDCSHAGDFCPANMKYRTEYFSQQKWETYRNVLYVTEQLHLLIDEVLLERDLTLVPYPAWNSDGWMKIDEINQSLPPSVHLCLTGWGFANPEEAMAFALTV